MSNFKMATKSKNMQSLKALMSKRDSLEAEIKALSEVLDSQGNVGMEGGLVDAEGYPRSDVDVYSVRHARHQIICLQNDHKALMQEIEDSLYKVHAEAREAKENETETKMEVEENQTLRKPFASVDRVDSGSPAESSGLHVGDKLVQFGSVTADNFKDLKSIGAVVQHSKDKPLHVSVIREGKQVNLSLTPKTWSGRGLLGCNIVPTKS